MRIRPFQYFSQTGSSWDYSLWVVLPTPPSHQSNRLEAFWEVKVWTKTYNNGENDERQLIWLKTKHWESKHKWQ